MFIVLGVGTKLLNSTECEHKYLTKNFNIGLAYEG